MSKGLNGVVGKGCLVIVFGIMSLFQNIAMAEVSSSILAQSNKSWDGNSFKYPQGDAELTVQKIIITASDKEVSLSNHCHPVPLAGYILKGSVKVIKPSGEHVFFKSGDALIEVVDTWHKGIFTENTELIVFYAGKLGMPLTVFKEDNSALSDACK